MIMIDVSLYEATSSSASSSHGWLVVSIGQHVDLPPFLCCTKLSKSAKNSLLCSFIIARRSNTADAHLESTMAVQLHMHKHKVHKHEMQKQNMHKHKMQKHKMHKHKMHKTQCRILGKFEYTRGPIFKVVLEC